MSFLASNEFLTECENQIRAGRVDLVSKRLAGLNTAQVPRSLRLPFANLARRTGLIAMGLKILRPVAHPENGRLLDGASAQELAEYGVLLQKSGAIQEALWTLDHVRVEQAPDALLYRGFCHFSRWEYAQAADILQKYVSMERRVYQRLVGSVNRAAALIVLERWEDAEAIIQEIFQFSLEGGYKRLQANGLELRAQIQVHRAQYEGARSDLTEAASILAAGHALDQLWIKKWIAILDSLQFKDTGPIELFRQQAIQRRNWESVREADHYLLKVRFDQKLFDKLLFGSPFTFFRWKLIEEHPNKHSSFYVHGSDNGIVLDLQTGCGNGGKAENPPRKVHHVLAAVARDFYRPIGIGGLFAELFPGEHFDISPPSIAFISLSSAPAAGCMRSASLGKSSNPTAAT